MNIHQTNSQTQSRKLFCCSGNSNVSSRAHKIDFHNNDSWPLQRLGYKVPPAEPV